MKVLTVRQPWASRIIAGKKKSEFRGRPTRYRGSVAIHAGLQAERGETDEMPRGAIIGVVEIVGCRELEPGRFAWKLANPRALKKPIPARGQLGLWNYPRDL